MRPFVDALMLAFLSALMAHTYLSGAHHEAVGLCLLLTVGFHLRLSIRKSSGTRRGTFSWYRFACRTAEILFAVNLLLMAVTGISLARGLFVLIEPPLRPSLARPLHRILAHTGFLLAGIHLGLRLPGFLGLVGFRRRAPASGRFSRLFLYLFCGALASYGLSAAVRRDYFKISLRSNLLTFSNPEDPIAFFLMDHAAILFLAVCSGVLVRRLLRSIETLNRNKG